jgi:hypothetical protein
MIGFKTGLRTGKHYELAIAAIKRIKRMNFLLKGKDERDCEFSLVSRLESSRKLRPHLITQVSNDPKHADVVMTRADFFGFRHSPDVAIGADGTAIDLKLIKGSHSIRDMLGQGICYRTNYRFVVLVFIGSSSTEPFIDLCRDKKSPECSFLTALASDFNIFSVIGPGPNDRNIAFF